MAGTQDPTEPIRVSAASFPDVVVGMSCNQYSFKAGKGAFLYVGPGAKGIGFKAMFKLDHSMDEARRRATQEPDRYQAGSTGWVTTRFTADKPLPKSVWEKWLRESYEICVGTGAATKRAKKAAAKKTTKKKAAAKK